jgi:hypothetical protein
MTGWLRLCSTSAAHVESRIPWCPVKLPRWSSAQRSALRSVEHSLPPVAVPLRERAGGNRRECGRAEIPAGPLPGPSTAGVHQDLVSSTRRTRLFRRGSIGLRRADAVGQLRPRRISDLNQPRCAWVRIGSVATPIARIITNGFSTKQIKNEKGESRCENRRFC